MKTLINSLDRQFADLHRRSSRLLEQIPAKRLFSDPRKTDLEGEPGWYSPGGMILRSAAVVEQTFGGITARLWDDPFEWTLPEELSNRLKIQNYLDEVEQTRQNGTRFFSSDLDLSKQIPAPEELRTISDILIETLSRAEHLQGRAFALTRMFSDSDLPLK